MSHLREILTVSIVASLGLSLGASAETAVFTDAFEMKVQNDGLPSVLGSSTAGYFLDAGNPVAGNPATGPGDSAHAYDFLRFENMFGSAPGQIPAGATVLSATLTMTTGTRANSQSGGPFGVAPLLAPFAASNVYADYTGPKTGYDAGPSYLNGYAGRPAGGFSGLTQGTKSSADVTSLLQQWSAAPSTAYGFAISSGTTDGWFLETTGSPTVENRPSLSVEYTTAPTTTYHFQEGVNGYAGTTMQMITSQDTSVKSGTTMNGAYLDGPNGTDSFDVQALIKFDNLFGGLEGQVKPGEKILRAYLVLTTVDSTESHSGGSFDAHQMLVGWDGFSNFTSFGGDGPTIEQGEISNPLSSARGMTHGSRQMFDVTSAVDAWENGASNFGLNVQSNTTDGWQIFWTGAGNTAVRPELVVITGVPEPTTGVLLGGAAIGLLGLRRRRA